MGEILEIDNEILQKIYSTFPVKTKKYGWTYIFFSTIEKFDKSPKFISVNGDSFRDGTKSTAIENARKHLYKTPTDQFVLISPTAWKDIGYVLINGLPVKQSSY